MFAQLRLFIQLSRLFDALYPVLSLLLGLALVDRLDDARLVAGLVFIVVLFNSVAMVWNDIEDRKIDAANGRQVVAQSDVAVLRGLVWLTVAACLVGLVAAWLIGLWCFLLALLTIGIIWLYNSRPLQASRRPVASILVLSAAGALLPYLFGVSVGVVTTQVIVAGLFWWLGRLSLSLLKDYKDARGDALHGKRTFLLRYGARRVAYFSLASLVLGYGGFVLVLASGGGRELLWLLPLIGGIGWLAFLRRPLFITSASYSRLDGVFRQVAQYQVLLDMGLVLWLI